MAMKLNGVMGASALALALVLTLGGCGKDGEPKATQVAARVNGDEITVHQINNSLAKLGNLNAEQSKEAAKQILKSLVDQQLVVARAIEDKVDRDPKVVQALEENRRQILANAYIERIAQGVAQPTDVEIKDYYAKNPALFSERRVYKFQELAIQTTPENAAAIQAKLAEMKNPGEFVAWLKAQNIPARGGQSVKTAEQLPMELLPRLHAMKPGQFMVMNGTNRITLLFLADAQSQPIAEERAKPLIATYLVNSKKREIAAAELKKLREKAKIEYVGEYSEADKGTAQVSATAAAPAKTETAGGMDASAIAKGVQGLQ